MNKTIVKALTIVVEVGLDVLADLIKQRRKRNGNSGQLDRYPSSRRVDDRPVRIAYPLHARRQVR